MSKWPYPESQGEANLGVDISTLIRLFEYKKDAESNHSVCL
jgi:hypothetical protein